MEELVLDFKTADVGASWVDAVDLTGISNALKAPIFTNLKKLTIDCRFRLVSPDNADYVMERKAASEVERYLSEGPFSDFHGRGILHFDHTEAWKDEGMLIFVW